MRIAWILTKLALIAPWYLLLGNTIGWEKTDRLIERLGV